MITCTVQRSLQKTNIIFIHTHTNKISISYQILLQGLFKIRRNSIQRLGCTYVHIVLICEVKKRKGFSPVFRTEPGLRYAVEYVFNGRHCNVRSTTNHLASAELVI